MPMYNPSHPGRIVRSGCLEPLGLSVTAGARALGVSRQALSSLVNGRAAGDGVRLGKAFDTNPELWIRMQAAWDIAQMRKWADEIKVERYAAAPLALD